MRSRYVYLVAAFLLSVLMVSGCARPLESTVTDLFVSSAGLAEESVVILIPEEPASLNPYTGESGLVWQVTNATIEGLVGFTPDGDYYPVVAAEIPSRANGGVSEDFLSVVWKLKPGLRWSDGVPVTSDDIKFTWEVISNPDSGALQTGGFDLIDQVDTPDELTAVVHYRSFYVGYLSQFRLAIFPRHAAGLPREMETWAWNRAPVVTGPFVVTEWSPGQALRMQRNPYYREEGKPSIEAIEFQVVPSYETQIAIMKRGEAHAQVWPIESKDVYDEQMAGSAILSSVPGLWNMELNFNLSQPFDNDPGPTPPHPILGDLRVRQAIAHGIDYDYIIDEVMAGEVLPSASAFEYGWFDCNMDRPYPTDLDKARALLDDAGWTDADEDGIRECTTCDYAEAGTPLRLQLLGYTYDTDLQRLEEVIVEQMRAIGIEMYIQNEDFAVIFGSWADNAPRKTGDFDLQIYDGLLEAEPQSTVESQWHSSQIPTANNPAGRNYFRWVNSSADLAIESAGSTPELTTRKDAYCSLAQEIASELPVLYLFLMKEGHGFSTRLHGYQVNAWGSISWDIENWMIDR